MKLHQFDSLFEEGKYTIIQAPTGRGKTWEIALLHLKRLAEAQTAAPKENRKGLTNARTDDSQRSG